MKNIFRKPKFRKMNEGESFLPEKKYTMTKKSYMVYEDDYDLCKPWVDICSNFEFTVDHELQRTMIFPTKLNRELDIGYIINPKWCYEIL